MISPLPEFILTGVIIDFRDLLDSLFIFRHYFNVPAPKYSAPRFSQISRFSAHGRMCAILTDHRIDIRFFRETQKYPKQKANPLLKEIRFHFSRFEYSEHSAYCPVSLSCGKSGRTSV